MGPVASFILIVLWLAIGVAVLGATLGPVWALVFIVFTAAAVRCILLYRRATGAEVFSILASAVRQVLPLPEVLYLEAGTKRGALSKALRHIADGLVAGLPLGDAIRAGWRFCPGHALALIEAGERFNQLPQALEALDADFEQKRNDEFLFRAGHPLYPLLVMSATVLLTSLVLIRLVPMFRDMFGGMGIPLPVLTQWVLEGGADYVLWGRIAFMVLLLGGGACYVYSLFRPRRPYRPRILSRAGDFLKWRLPGLRWFERNASLVQTVEAMRLSLRAGATIDQAVAQAADMDVNLSYRRRLRKWLARIQRGEDVSQAAAASGVGKGLAWAMDTRVNPSGSLDALEMMERLYRANYNYARATAGKFFWPCVTIAVGLLVAAVALAIMEPMAAIVQINATSVIPK
jgi:type IV pilus assembly protein PilC